MNGSGIYKIQSKCKPERFYIGSGMDLHRRIRNHKSCLKGGYHINSKMQRHCDKYGVDDFEFSVVLYCDIEKLLEEEQYLLDVHQPFFNICLFAGNTKGRLASTETRKKISEGVKGNKGRRGQKLTAEHKKQISKTHKGKLNPMYGVEPWNKGAKGKQVAWNKGKTGVQDYSQRKKEKLCQVQE